MSAHYIALISSYSTISGLWFLFYKYAKNPWQHEPSQNFNKPWLEFIYAIAAIVAILVIGQLYMANMLIPNDDNKYIDAVNQLLIFSPTILIVILRKQSFDTIWLPKKKVGFRIGFGLALSLVALVVYWLFRKETSGFLHLLSETYHLQNISHLVQVFLEDITIALLFVRLAACIGRRWTIGLVALLFAAGHLPSLLAEGAAVSEFISLLLDVGIGVVVLSVVSKSRDAWWFFPVHFVLDMSQYYG